MAADRIDPAGRETILAATLAEHPDAFIAAIAPTGLFVPLPAELTAGTQRPIEGPSSALGLAVAEDQRTVIEAWHRALAEGVANCVIRPIAAPDRQARLHLIDVTPRLGIFVGLLTGLQDHAAPALQLDGVRPRLVTVHKDATSVISEAGPEITQLLGWSPAELVGRRTLDLLHPDDHERAIASWMDLLNSPLGAARRVRLRHLHRDGHPVWFEITNHNRLTDPDRPGIVAEMLDITDEMAAQEAVRAAEQLMRRLTETLPSGVLQIDADRRIVYLNDRAARCIGVKAGEVLGEGQLDAVLPADRDAVDEALDGVLISGGDVDLEFGHRLPGRGVRRFRANLRALSDEAGAVTGAIVCLADVTEDVRMREELRQRATYDGLTGCYNRAATLGALHDAVTGSDVRGTAVVFVDLNGFKQINDRYGHAAGDLLLTHVATRLRLAVADNGLVGRLGGDEFVVIRREVADAEQAHRLGADLLEALTGGGIEVNGQVLGPEASVGVAWAASGTTGPDELIARADAAMYEAKKNRTGPFALVLAG
ncbi:diguanylate cyclase domain-containing protein [Actinoplanes sp. HUAS TT8]|uniref:diguanylate cyclase domain-containing protein n=1 Tax=Actinoplanes sp. HUAS TT8 TaxID=3447453 RepID=UPI003F520E47